MHLAVFTTDPYAGSKTGDIAYEPTVGVVVGGACLARCALDAISPLDAAAGTFVDHALHQVDHKKSGLCAECLPLAGGKTLQQVPLAVLYLVHEHTVYKHAPGRVCVVCRYHLIYRDVAGAHAEGIDRLQWAADAHLAAHPNHRLGAELLHKEGRDIVG